MNDSTVTVQQLREAMGTFVHERDWEQFHTPKNLSMSIAIEAAELMEHFQWRSPEESNRLDAALRHQVAEELSDIVLYALSMANALDLDLSQALLAKLEKNRRKYPAEQVRGKAHKYTHYRPQRDDTGER